MNRVASRKGRLGTMSETSISTWFMGHYMTVTNPRGIYEIAQDANYVVCHKKQ